MTPLLRDATGSVVTLFALTLPMLLGFGALAVDVGHFYLERRALQAASDAAVLAAVADPETAEIVAGEILARNGYPEATFRLERGDYAADGNLHRNERFIQNRNGASLRLYASTGTQLFLGRLLTSEPPTVSVHSDAHREIAVSLSAGSRLASLNGGLANDVLGVIGGGLSLSLLDYDGLANVGLRLGPLLDDIVRLARIPAVVGTVNGVLDQEISLQVLLRAMASGLREQGRNEQARGLEQASGEAVAVRTRLKLGDMLRIDESLGGLQLGYPSRALAAEVSVLSLVSAALADREGGNVLTLELPAITGQLMLGERMQTVRSMAIGGVGAEVETAQVRLQLEAGTVGVLDNQFVRLGLPLEVVVAGGRAWVSDISCAANPAHHRVVVAVQPGVAKLEVGRFSGPIGNASVNSTLPRAGLVRLGLLDIYAHARIRIGEGQPQYVTFHGTQIGTGHVETVRTHNITRGLVSSLLGDLHISARALGFLPLPVSALLNPLLAPIKALLTPLTIPVDTLLNAVLGLVGVGIGEMDVRVDGIACNTGRLVG